MKPKYQIDFFIFCSLFLIEVGFNSCKRHIESQVDISPNKTENSSYLGYGVWLEIPYEYKRAESYVGFQTLNWHSSISIKMDKKTIDQTRETYNPKRLRKINMDLIELSTVNYSGNENGLLSVVLDKKKKIIRYLMSIQFKGETYNLKAFCLEAVKEEYDPLIRKIFESIYIGEFVQKEELFKVAKLLSPDEVIYTKDGVYPTATLDGAVIEIKRFASLEGVLKTGMIQSELEKLTGEEKTNWTYEELSNGKFHYGKSETDTKKAFVALLTDKNNEVILLKCYGNQNSDLNEFEQYVRNKLIKTEVQGY